MRTLAASLALLALAHAAAAQLTEKQAVAELKAASKDQLKTFKQAGADAISALNDALAGVEGELSGSTLPTPFAEAVNQAVLGFLVSVEGAYEDASFGFGDSGAQTLQSLGGGGTLGGVYPKDFVPGAGGVIDQFHVALDKAAAKLHDAAVKRLAKTAAKAEKVAGLALAVELRLPSRELSQMVDQNSVQSLGEGARLDAVVAASLEGAVHDGVIEVSGTTTDLADDIDVGIESAAGSLSSGATSVPVGGRFGVELLSLPEGACIAFVKQAGLPFSTVSIGLR